MEKTVCDFFFSAFVLFHNQIGLLVIVLLLLWLMSGRRPDAWTYTGVFVKLVTTTVKKSMKVCEIAARETALAIPPKHIRWRLAVRLFAQPVYCTIVILSIVLLVKKCAGG